MGVYLNPGNREFYQAVRSKIYVDKTMLIAHTNSVLDTEQKYISVSRPRRFGKSIAVNMLAAYYGRGCDSRELFSNFKIAKSPTFEEHLNKYNVIRINMRNALTRGKTVEGMIAILEKNDCNGAEKRVAGCGVLGYRLHVLSGGRVHADRYSICIYY
ncbi:MAG: AAA family ATPase [Lachnospiraceae bacterium]|nr:AAA family ATPase [Lachnospiraceae bacterium]